MIVYAFNKNVSKVTKCFTFTWFSNTLNNIHPINDATDFHFLVYCRPWARDPLSMCTSADLSVVHKLQSAPASESETAVSSFCNTSSSFIARLLSAATMRHLITFLCCHVMLVVNVHLCKSLQHVFWNLVMQLFACLAWKTFLSKLCQHFLATFFCIKQILGNCSWGKTLYWNANKLWSVLLKHLESCKLLQ